ncbi:hypothetical protein Msil_2285 [Methylocella silvestris BL2]|uniref:Uncharacterized protein n=1 Tax=Methylocella silvestris (strain DSM 15510 / CIP 108128 / LMG 27833 / NCIMB 13906 / BL2) TaxID=395965 RepID=B8EI98_METSB|nr:hypothetical protein [Methylocella silvestris]ACK51217.1 hypothetical protein Msil_2285 [Methylocella silvestris BL2]
MSALPASDDNQEQNKSRDRSRLIDHFKRVYSIVAGLAITEACRQIWPFSWDSFANYRFWMFATFFVTIVPIFHGGDRSLDHKYLDHETTTTAQRFKFIWDVYMLLITAILFVGIAEAIPKPSAPGAAPPDPAQFYLFMAFLFAFDVFVLIVDYLKSDAARKQKLWNSYALWVPVNSLMGVLCWAAAHGVNQAATPGASAVPSLPVIVSILIFIAAAARTLVDYWRTDKLMFP